MIDPVERGIRKAVSHCLTLAKDSGPLDFEDIRQVMLSMLYGYLDGRADAKEAGEPFEDHPAPQSIQVVVSSLNVEVRLYADQWLYRSYLFHNNDPSSWNLVDRAIRMYAHDIAFSEERVRKQFIQAWKKVPVEVGFKGVGDNA